MCCANVAVPKNLVLVPVVALIALFFMWLANVNGVAGNPWTLVALFAVSQLGFFVPGIIRKEFKDLKGLPVIVLLAAAGVVGYYAGAALMTTRADLLSSTYLLALVLVLLSVGLREIMEVRGWWHIS